MQEIVDNQVMINSGEFDYDIDDMEIEDICSTTASAVHQQKQYLENSVVEETANIFPNKYLRILIYLKVTEHHHQLRSKRN